MSKKYEVGYGKPPKGYQWKPGQSGNPAGKPKNQKQPKSMADYFAAELLGMVSPVVNGKKQNMPLGQALAKALLAETMSDPTKTKLAVLEKLDKLGVLKAMDEMIEEQMTELSAPVGISEEERLMLEALNEAVNGDDDT